VAGGFSAGVITGRRYRQTGGGAGAACQLQARSAATAPQHGAQQQMRRECPVDRGGTTLNTDSLHYSSWRRGVVVSGVRRMNEVNARRARLVLGWVTVFGRVHHLGV